MPKKIDHQRKIDKEIEISDLKVSKMHKTFPQKEAE
jgi:hypothetical protein